MKWIAAALVLFAGVVASATASEYTLANRPEVIFPGPRGGIVHISPYPAGKRATAVWASDACWRACKTNCTWRMETCVSATDADACRPHLDACDRACVRSCRTRGGPFVGIFDIDW
jgi:hypothetical protein